MSATWPARDSSVFVVDDDPDLRHALARYLRDCDMHVRTLSSGEELVHTVTANVECDFILTDIMMAGLSGVAAAKILRERGVEAPLLFMTADTDLALLQQARELSGRGVLIKPFPLAHLDVAISQLSNSRGSVAS